MNVLYRLQPPRDDPDHAEMMARDLVHEEQRHGRTWWRVRCNEIDGPQPIFRRFASREAEMDALGKRVAGWIRDDGVRPADIRVLANAPIRKRVTACVAAALRDLGVRVEARTSARMYDEDDVVLVTTAHSFKATRARSSPCRARIASWPARKSSGSCWPARCTSR